MKPQELRIGDTAMSKYRTTLVKGRNGQTVYAVEELNEQNEWTTIKVFTNRQSAENEKQTLEAYGKKKS